MGAGKPGLDLDALSAIADYLSTRGITTFPLEDLISEKGDDLTSAAIAKSNSERAYRVLSGIDMKNDDDVLGYLSLQSVLEAINAQLLQAEPVIAEAERDELEVDKALANFVAVLKEMRENLSQTAAQLKEKPELKPVLDISEAVRAQVIPILVTEEVFVTLATTECKPDIFPELLARSKSRLNPKSTARLAVYFDQKIKDVGTLDDEAKEQELARLKELISQIDKLNIGINLKAQKFSLTLLLGKSLKDSASNTLEYFLDRLDRAKSQSKSPATYYWDINNDHQEKREKIAALREEITLYMTEPVPEHHTFRKSKNGEWNDWKARGFDLTRRVQDIIFHNFGTNPMQLDRTTDQILPASLPYLNDIIAAYNLAEEATALLDSLDQPGTSYLKHTAKKAKLQAVLKLLKPEEAKDAKPDSPQGPE